MKRYQQVKMILETEELNLEWKEVLKSLGKHLETLKVSLKEAHLDLVSENDHIFEVFEEYDREEDSGGRWNWYGFEDDEPVH